MAFRNPLRPGHAVLLCASLTASLGAVGCNVYDEEELLRRRDDIDGSVADATTRPSDAAGKDEAAHTGDAAARIDGDAAVYDTITTDTPPLLDTGATSDASAPDGATQDAGAPRADGATLDSASADALTRDTNAINDAHDAPFDATGTRDADASPPSSDAQDVAINDGSGGTVADASDAGIVDVATDVIHPFPTFRVVRVGDGTASLSATSAPAFVEERRWDGSLVGSALALPIATAGSQHPLTISGNATSEGALALSLDARFLTLAGYATEPGHASVASSTDVDRVAARIDASGSIDTSTLLGGAFSGSNVRSATSLDGTAFWIGGTGGGMGGVWFFPLGGGAGAQIVTAPDNVRLVALFGDQLYGSSGASPMTSVFTVGAGRPTTGVQNVTALSGMPRSGMSPYAFALLDLNTTVAGLDTLYLTDDRSPESDGSGGGIQKWSFDGSAWSRVATFTSVGGADVSFRGLAATPTPTGVTLVASTSESSGNRLVVFLDNGSPNATGTVVATASSNTIFRGVALSPHP